MILLLFTDNESNIELEKNFVELAKEQQSNVNYIVSKKYAKLIDDIETRNDICVISDSDTNSDEIIELIDIKKYKMVIMQYDNPKISAYLENKGVEVYCKKSEDYFNKYYRLKKQYDELQNQLTENNNYIQSLSVHATKLDDELKQYKKLYDGDNVQTELKRLQKQRDEYLDLYRNLLDKLDQLTIENLNYKKKGK